MADPTSLEWQIVDDQGLTNRVQAYLAYDGSTETVDAIIGKWTLVGGLIDACVDGQIVGGQMLVPFQPDSGWKSAPATGNNVNQVMNLNFNNDYNQYATAILLPSYKETQLLTGRPNPAATALAALIAEILHDASGGNTSFFNSRDLHALNALRDAFLTVRKVRNQKAGTKVLG